MTAPDLSAGQQTSPQPEPATTRTPLTPVQKKLIALVVTGGVLIAAIGFTGSYVAVSDLAASKHFGWFARIFPIGVDAGIAVMLALDLVLTGLRMPFPLLRQAAWFLTAATIAFNASSAWGDWLAVGMHATLPTLFIVTMEAARHAVGRIAQIEAGAHYENPPFPRWFLAPWPTYRIWRRMRMWHIQSYSRVIEMEREAKVLRATLRTRHGRGWRRAADKQELLALRLAKIGTPVGETLAGRFDEEPPTRAGNVRRAASATALPAAVTATPSIASPPPASASSSSASTTKAASARPETATPSSTPATNTDSVYVPAPGSATANPAPGSQASTATGSTPAASHAEPATPGNKTTASGEQRDLDEVAQAFRNLRNRLDKAPSDAALAAELGVSRSRAQQLRTAAIAAGHTDLEKPLRAAS